MTDQSGAGQAEKIRALNDAFRKSFTGAGRRYVTAGISALSLQQQAAIMPRMGRYHLFFNRHVSRLPLAAVGIILTLS